MHHGRAASGVCVVAVITALSGCGGSDTTAKFTSGYNAVRGPLNQTFQAIEAELQRVSTQTDAQAGAAFESIATRFRGQVAQLKALKAPSSVAGHWKNVTDAATRLDADLNRIGSAANSHNRPAAQLAFGDLETDEHALTDDAAFVKQKLGLK